MECDSQAAACTVGWVAAIPGYWSTSPPTVVEVLPPYAPTTHPLPPRPTSVKVPEHLGYKLRRLVDEGSTSQILYEEKKKNVFEIILFDSG